ncbi:MAG: hypothetical protein Q7K03_02340 [Dehalococcoidia bacterium]|nr:hypothetical protein [Dehalococcoidia bacterium]
MMATIVLPSIDLPLFQDITIVNREEEEDFRLMGEISRRRHIPFLQGRWTLEVFDKPVEQGGILIHRHSERAHSAVRNYYNWLFSQGAGKDANTAVFGAGSVNIKTTAGVTDVGAFPIGLGHNASRDTNAAWVSVESAATTGLRGPTADATQGIVVGSGLGAYSFEDFKLGTQILNGTGGGQLSHVLGEVPVLSYDAGTKTLTTTHARFFNNNSGGPIDVNELSLYCLANDASVVLAKFAVERTVLGATVTIPNTGQLKVTYVISLVYPA